MTCFDNDPVQFKVKCDPEIAIDLRERYDCVIPGYHMNKKHWNTIVMDGKVSPKLVKQWIDHSYDLILASMTKKVKVKLVKSKSAKRK